MQPSAAATWFLRHLEVLIFSLLTIAYLTPIWVFTYIPTQDGPAHLNNAQIMRDCADPASANARYFELRDEPMPNLTSQVLLIGLLYIVPPLIAEKLLVSLYVVGFALAYRYFLGAFGPRCLPLSWLALLFVYQRCFWMGFYNYCLGVIVLWLILGLWLRGCKSPSFWHPLALMLLFLVAYFTHLVALLLAVIGAGAIALLASQRRLLALGIVSVAALPTVCMTLYYFDATGFFRARAPNDMFARVLGRPGQTSLGQDFVAIDDELFAHHVGSAVPGTLVLVFFLALLAIFTAVEARYRRDETSEGSGPLFPALFGLLLFFAYFLVPYHLGEHGGFLKTRLAPLFFLVWIGCLRESAHRDVRIYFRVVTGILLALNLVLVFETVAAGNRELERYNAGIDAVGTGQRLFVIQPDQNPTPLVNPLLHAADYYCLGTGNVNFDNYQAETIHFTVKYRRGVQRGRNHWNSYRNRDDVDIILCWRTPGSPAPRVPAGWVEVFGQEPLVIYRRGK